MALTVKHPFVSPVADVGNPNEVGPDEWNDDHDVTGELPVANGGTGATDASTARTNLGLGALATLSSLALDDLSDVDTTGAITGEVLTFQSGSWLPTTSGAGDVTAASAFGTDNLLLRSDGTGKGVQASGITVDDSDNLTGVANLALVGTLVGIQRFTSSGTYTPTSGTTRALVIAQAAGGGSGGVGSTAGTGRSGHGGAGETRIAVATITSTETVTIGAAGTGGASGNNAGTTASDTTFGAHVTAKGGTGGGGSDGSDNGATGTTPTGSGGIQIPTTNNGINTSAAYHLAAGTIFSNPIQTPSPTTNAGASNGGGRGGGGVGAIDTGTTSRAGADGAGGMVLVVEYR